MRDREQFTAWISKYALSGGIVSKRVELCSEISENMVSVLGGQNECYHGSDWHRTEADAIAQAKKMQERKLASLDKQKAKVAARTWGF